MKYDVITYNSVRNVFKSFSEQFFDIQFAENRDTLCTAIKIEKNDAILGFYFSFGNRQVTVIEDETIKVITTDERLLAMKIQTIVETFVKKQNKNVKT